MHVRVLVSISPSWTDIQSLIHFINPIQFQFALSPPQTWARHPPHHRIVVVCHREAIVNVNWTVWLVWSVGLEHSSWICMNRNVEKVSFHHRTLYLTWCARWLLSLHKTHNTARSSRLKKKKSAREQQLNGLYRYPDDGGGVKNQLYIHSEADIMYCTVYSPIHR